ncbi:PopZ family protein [Bradyrhizobium sp. HKCCYLR20261]|uniref:PopZ family protein n=1 Tax=unclassified Bradyrhizobium TaxID=2631580 RepID=UPI003EBA4631
MTQPAKVQEPSMEEILASIRRIIADDEGKPAAAEKAAAPEPVKAEKPAAAAAPKPVMNDIPPSKIAPAKPAPAPPPAAAASNSQDDIDALLAGLDETTPAVEARAPEPEPEPEPEVLELTDDMAVAPPTPAPAPAPAPAAASFKKVEPQDDIEFIEAGRVNKKAASFDSAFEPVAPKQPILAPQTVNAVESAFNALANTVLSNNARTLEDLVKEMLRPMLKSWLDDNLPALVERIVKAEIERVSRGR